jgi:hypothetical protein
MLFPLEPRQQAAFWMKNCLIPLDLLFVKDQTIVQIIHQAPPCKKLPCPVYRSQQPVDWVIEIPGGQAKKQNIRAGMSVCGLQE